MKKLAYVCAAALFLTNLSAYALSATGSANNSKRGHHMKTTSTSKHMQTTKTRVMSNGKATEMKKK